MSISNTMSNAFSKKKYASKLNNKNSQRTSSDLTTSRSKRRIVIKLRRSWQS